jgi:hypothetical protein
MANGEVQAMIDLQEWQENLTGELQEKQAILLGDHIDERLKSIQESCAEDIDAVKCTHPDCKPGIPFDVGQVGPI